METDLFFIEKDKSKGTKQAYCACNDYSFFSFDGKDEKDCEGIGDEFRSIDDDSIDIVVEAEFVYQQSRGRVENTDSKKQAKT